MKTRSISLLFFLAAAACLSQTSVAADDLSWPAVTRQQKPWTRWWWMASAYSEADVTQALAQYAEVGLGGVEVTPIYGVHGTEAQWRPFLSEAWIDLFQHTLRQAEVHDMGVDLANASGWPFGGPWVPAEHACKTKISRTWLLKGGQTLSEPVRCHQERMIRALTPEADMDAKVLFPVARNSAQQLQDWALEQAVPDRWLPLLVLTATDGKGHSVELTDRVAADGTLQWTAPAGSDWTLCALFEGNHGKLVERAGPGGAGDVIDHFSEPALQAYLRKFDEVFAGRDISTLRYWFNDSYEVDDARGTSDWTPRLFDEFQARRGYDLRSVLPALLGLDTPDRNSRVTYDFRQTIDDLLLERYSRPWQQWAAAHGKGIRNQAHGSPANILDLYAVSDVPEIEGRDLISIKAAPSVAHVTGKTLVSSESATWQNEHYYATLGDVKQTLDRFFLGGVNHIFYHGTCFSPTDAEWPGWEFYAATHFEPANPFWADFAHLNQYVTRVQSFLQQGQTDTDLLVYYNITDQQSEFFAQRPLRHYAGLDREMQTSHTRQCVARIDSLGYAWDMISDRQILALTVRQGALVSQGGHVYKALLIPASHSLPFPTLQHLLQLARQGAHIVFEGDLPADFAGLADYEARRAVFANLRNELRGLSYQTSDLSALGADLRREPMYGEGLLCQRRRVSGDEVCYFIANRSERAYEGWLPLALPERYADVRLFDAMTGRTGYGRCLPAQGQQRCYLQLQPGQSILVLCAPREPRRVAERDRFAFYRIASAPALDLSRASWQVRFLSGGPTLPSERVVTTLTSWTEWGDEALRVFSGVAEYSTMVQVDKCGARAFRLCMDQVCNSASVYVDGRYVGCVLDMQHPTLDIPAECFGPTSTLTIRVASSMRNRIADLDRRGVKWKKFYNINMSGRLPENRDAHATLDASRWEPQPSGLIGTVCLQPLTQ